MISPVFLIGVQSDSLPDEVQFWGVIGFMIVAGALAIWETRRGMWGREAARVDRSSTRAYVAAMAAVALLAVALDPVGPPAWYILAALLPAVPCLVAARRILRR